MTRTNMAAAGASDWAPFVVEREARLAPRAISRLNNDGIGDRLRTAAFAEMQAEAAFVWAAENLGDAPEELRRQWLRLASDERRHLGWLLERMRQLGVRVDERPVSDQLWLSLTALRTAEQFCHYMADAERRGQRAGERFAEALREIDPLSGAIFGRIAAEESAHIALAFRYFPKADTQVAEPSRNSI